jgi:hypothetical protein
MKHIGKFAILAALTSMMAGVGLVATTAPAAAFIACNHRGECWHVQDRFAYPPGEGIVIHPDDWHWGRHDHFRFREHGGRGFWRGGVWVTL